MIKRFVLLELKLEHIKNIPTKITVIITIIDKNYNYSNNYEIFIIDYISVYADLNR